MYETFSEWPIGAYFQWGLHLSIEKTSNFLSPYPTRLWSKRFHLNSTEEEAEEEEEDDEEEEDEEEDREEEGNRAKRRKA